MATTYFQDTIKNSGSYSIKIQNQNNPTFGDLQGIAWLGSAGTSTANYGIYGIPFTQNITAFGGFFKYSITAPSGVDTGVVFCQTTKWTGAAQTLIEDASILLSSNTTGFQNITQNAAVVNPGIPDTLWIISVSSYWPSLDSIPNASDGYTSTLNMDDLTLTTVTGVKAPVLNLVDTRIAPNPASDVIRFTTSALNIGGYFRIFNAIGNEVLRVQVTNSLNNYVNVETLPAGIYFYEVSNSEGVVDKQGKLIIVR